MKSDHVQVWKYRLPPTVDAAAFDLLHEEERARAQRYSNAMLRNHFVGARAFLRQALGFHLGIAGHDVAFCYGNRGKPALEGGGNCRFNLSHSEDLVLLAVSSGREVGIDVEDQNREIDVFGLANRYFSPAETEWVMSHSEVSRSRAFLTCWTGKEAYIKARGDGLSFPLDAFQVLPAADGLTLELKVYDDPEESKRWSMRRLFLGTGLSAAIAVEGFAWTLEVTELTSLHSFLSACNAQNAHGHP